MKNIFLVIATAIITLTVLVGCASNDNKTELLGDVTEYSYLHLKADFDLFTYFITPNERILITVDSPGGSGKTMSQIKNLIEKSPIPVDTYVPSEAASAGAITFILGEHKYVEPNARILFHGGHYGSYALTEVTLKNALFQLESGRIESVLRSMLLKQGIPADLTLDEIKAIEICQLLAQDSGINGLHQTLSTMYKFLVVSNAEMVQTVSDHLSKVDSKYTYTHVKTVFFADFKEDVVFSGQDLIDMGLAEKYN